MCHWERFNFQKIWSIPNDLHQNKVLFNKHQRKITVMILDQLNDIYCIYKYIVIIIMSFCIDSIHLIIKK